MSGTLVYSRGDEREVKQMHEEMADGGEGDTETPRRRRESWDPATPRNMPVAGSAPIHMRATPGSFKVTPESMSLRQDSLASCLPLLLQMWLITHPSAPSTMTKQKGLPKET